MKILILTMFFYGVFNSKLKHLNSSINDSNKNET